MSRKLALVATAIVAAWLYRFVLLEAFGYLPIYILRPALLHGARDIGGQTLLRALFVVLDVVMVAVISLPFAILFARLYQKRWLLVAVAVACLPAIESLLDISKVWNEIAGSHWSWTWIYRILCVFWILAILPLLAYLARGWPPTRTRADPCQQG